MSQISFSDAEYAGKRKKTRREVFLEEMEQIVPWKALLKVLEPFYPVTGRGRRPYPLETMLRVHLMQNWFALSDPAMEEALYEIASLRAFAGLNLREAIPDETTILNFRHLLEEYDLAEDILKQVNAHLTRKGLMLKRGSIVDATIIAAPSSTKNAEGKRDPEMHQTKKGEQWHFGMKAHIAVDVDSGLVHTVTTTPANESDVEQIDDLFAAVARPLNDLLQAFVGNELRHGNAAHGGAAWQGDHRVAVAAHEHGRDILDAHAQFHRQEGAVAGRVQHAGLSQHALRRKPSDLQASLDHCIQRVADDDHHRLGAGAFNLLGNGGDDLGVGAEQIVAAHARLARYAGGDHHHVAAAGILVAGRAHNVGVKTDNGRGFHQVERLAAGHALGLRNIDQHDVAQLQRCTPMGGCGAHIPGADDRDLGSPHDLLPFRLAERNGP